jgi:hypothetical protein
MTYHGEKLRDVQPGSDPHRSTITGMPMFSGHANPERHRDHSKKGIFIEHRCICLPSYLIPEEPKAKEKKFLKDNPDW